MIINIAVKLSVDLKDYGSDPTTAIETIRDQVEDLLFELSDTRIIQVEAR